MNFDFEADRERAKDALLTVLAAEHNLPQDQLLFEAQMRTPVGYNSQFLIESAYWRLLSQGVLVKNKRGYVSRSETPAQLTA